MKAEMLRGQFVNFSYDVHTHETACFALITAGQIRIRMRGTEFIANKGDLYAIDADQPHAGWAVDADGWKLRTLYVDTRHLRSLVQDSQGQPPRVSGPIIRNARLAHLLHSLHQGSEEQAPRLLRDQACIAFANELLHRHVSKPVATFVASQEPAAVRAAREMLDQHMGDQLSLQELAAAADVPPFRAAAGLRTLDRHESPRLPASSEGQTRDEAHSHRSQSERRQRHGWLLGSGSLHALVPAFHGHHPRPISGLAQLKFGCPPAIAFNTRAELVYTILRYLPGG